MAKSRGLGRGVEAFFPENNNSKPGDVGVISLSGETTDEAVLKLRITSVEPNRGQPRKTFDEEKLAQLSDSIKEHGVIQPIIVKKIDDKRYEIVAGERRWRAAKEAGLKEIPAIVREYADQKRLEVSLLENIQREDLNPIEEAEAYKQLIDEFGLKQDEVADRVSKSRVAITNSLRLLKLEPEVQTMVVSGELTTGHARALIPIEAPEEQKSLAKRIVKEKLNVRDTEKLIKNVNKPEKERKKREKEDKALKLIYEDYEKKLKTATGMKVKITGEGDGAGRLEIDFYSADDLERIARKLISDK
ncbi:MAG: ParB/RepB/Spo0J family partition protein [Lachnospiraceae bacterium]|nr:ParB/RepB/Spo0J family partition protein [Lachnospiraceae bacterium]